MLGKISNWYFRKSALPRWAVVIFDIVLCFFSALFVIWLRYSAIDILEKWPRLGNSLLAICAANVVGFRVFRTYAGILRYSQFVDLMRIVYSTVLAFFIYVVFNQAVISFGWDALFYVFTGRMLIGIFGGIMMVSCVARMVVKLVFENALVGDHARRVLVYGTHAGAIAISSEIMNTKPVKFVVEGFLGDSKPHYAERLMGKRIYSTQEDLKTIIRKHNIEALMVSPLKHDVFLNNRKLQDIFIDAGVKIYISRNTENWTKGGNQNEKVRMREIMIEDLLPRDEIEIDVKSVGELLRGKKVLITGSAGSIGSEMVRQIALFGPAEMMLVDQAETPQHDIRLMMRKEYPAIVAHTVVTNICKQDRMESIFSQFCPDYVFHAAAYKHVPMMEDNPSESVQNNVWGTKVIADLSVKYGVKKFVMISTDKAVNPTNVMGCSKRICEIYVQSLDKAIKDGNIDGVTQFVTTRFGNVLGSNGSVIPLFRKQLDEGGPLTVTHPDIVRYFMLIPEACKLVLEAGTHGKGGEIFVFDMGEPVRIADLAKRMIQLSGAKDVKIEYTGLRDGEKLYEEVLGENENTLPSFHAKIRIAKVCSYEYDEAERELEELNRVASAYDDMATVSKMKQIVPEYISNHSKYETLDHTAGK